MILKILLLLYANAQSGGAILECASSVSFTTENTNRIKKVYKPGIYQLQLANTWAVHIGKTQSTSFAIYPQNGIHYSPIKNNFTKIRTDEETYFEVYDSRNIKNPTLYCRII